MKLEELRARFMVEPSGCCACCGEPCDELVCSAKVHDRSAVCAWCFETCYDVLPGEYDHRGDEIGGELGALQTRCTCCMRAAFEPHADREGRITCSWCAYHCYDLFRDEYVHSHRYVREIKR